MYRLHRLQRELENPVPRRRGDVPWWDGWERPALICSPQTRGCTEVVEMLENIEVLFPADAGMYRPVMRLVMLSLAVPRRRGDVPGWLFEGAGRYCCSPQTRG